MNRSEFIKGLLAATGLAALPAFATEPIFKQYDKFYLLQCFVAGFRFYNGPECLAEMKSGTMLHLVREPENKYDPFAIALYYNNAKIGFIPRGENEMLSKLLDIGVPELLAEITHLEKTAASWENVAVAIFVLKEREKLETMPELLQTYTLLSAPAYYTVKSSASNEIITRVTLPKNPVKPVWEPYQESEDWFELLELAAPNDSIYESIFDLDADADYNADKKHFVILKKSNIDLSDSELAAPQEELNILPANKDYVVLNTDYLAKILRIKPYKLQHFQSIYGDPFVEISYKKLK